ncbi:MAG TPA: ATPase domain-containing protein [Oligoflexus sp.]|uniref:RAD55 family ATPase n=1 Tax=Oligoflexus sp. TaxID=1971216 RepID=UPI002D51355C|nr:ATPase domain-containing protein [Oligoflexus sp.]HYX35638.1 ATPase domain-containing protein [Oligoflexus sp.]
MSVNNSTTIGRIETGVGNLDAVLGGGLPERSVTVIAGPPGSGKTTLSHQIGFHAAGKGVKSLYFQTLGEPTAKRLQYLSQFSYFDTAKFETSVRFVDLGVLIRSEGIDSVIGLIMEHIKREKPALVVIDSFKAFGDLLISQEQSRKFNYELIIHLIAWECTALLLGEYSDEDFRNNPLFSVIDGVITMTQKEVSGEQLRMLRAVKMRGTAHNRDHHPFLIDSDGIQLFAPRVLIRRTSHNRKGSAVQERCMTGIRDLDSLLSDGIPRGTSMLVAGMTGTGKTVLLLNFIYEGATQFGEKGIIFSFDETQDKLYLAAHELGWDLEDLVDRGLVEIVFIPQPEVLVEEHLLVIKDRAEAMGAKRIALDSLSGFLCKIDTPQLVREKVYQLATIVQNLSAIGFFSSEVPYGSNQMSRFGIEETMLDGIIFLSLAAEGRQRKRFLEIYKLRHTEHQLGQHPVMIGRGGFKIATAAADRRAQQKNPKNVPKEKTHVRKKKASQKKRVK